MNRSQFIKAGLVMIGGIWVPKQQGATIIIRGPRVGAAAPAWTDAFAEGSIDASETIGDQSFGRITKAYSLPGGTVSKLRFKATGYTVTSNGKIALFSVSSTNLVVSGSISVTGNGVYEVSVTPTSISAGDYRFGLIADGGASDWAWGTLSGQTNAAYYHFTTYASFPPATIPTNEGNINEEFWVGAYIAS